MVYPLALCLLHARCGPVQRLTWRVLVLGPGIVSSRTDAAVFVQATGFSMVHIIVIAIIAFLLGYYI